MHMPAEVSLYMHSVTILSMLVSLSLGAPPTGLAAWIVEKFKTWSDCQGDVERRFSKDELLTNICIYWCVLPGFMLCSVLTCLCKLLIACKPQ